MNCQRIVSLALLRLSHLTYDMNNSSFPLEIRHFSNVRKNQPDQLSIHSLVFKAFAHGM